MSDNKSPLIALVDMSGLAPTGTHKAAIVNAVKSGIATERFSYVSFDEPKLFLDTLMDGKHTFDGAVYFYNRVNLEHTDEKFKDIIYWSMIYGIGRIVVVCDNWPDTDDHYDIADDFTYFMSKLGIKEEHFSYVSCLYKDFVHGDNPSQYTDMMRPMVEKINRVIIEPAMQPQTQSPEIESFNALIFTKRGDDQLTASTRATVKIFGEENIAYVNVNDVDYLATGIFVTAKIDLITSIPYVSGTRVVIKSRVSGNIMGVGSVI